jgi:hypothetical protein
MPYTITYSGVAYSQPSERVHHGVEDGLHYALAYCQQWGGYTEVRDRRGVLCWVVWRGDMGNTIISGVCELVPAHLAQYQEVAA